QNSRRTGACESFLNRSTLECYHNRFDMNDARSPVYKGEKRRETRIAWFSPLPPVRTGIAGRSAELVDVLRERAYSIETYPESSAHDFPWLHRRRAYDLIVYQFGNSSHHDYEWAYAVRYPGLVALHDTHLHHARAS